MAANKQIIKTNKLTEERMAKIKGYISQHTQAREQLDPNKGNNVKEHEEEKKENQPEKKVHRVLCEPCRVKIKKEQEAVGFCEECFEYLCNSCVETHKKGRIMRTQAHNILQGTAMPRFTSNEFFDDAYERCKCKFGVVKYFCKEHNCLICKTCKINNHRSCKFADITNISKDFSVSREFRNEIKEFKAIRIKCEKYRKARQKEIEDFSASCLEIMQEINKIRTRVTTALDKCEEDVRKELNHLIKKEELSIKDNQVKCETLKLAIEKKLKTIDRLKEQNNEAALFLTFHRNQGEREKLQKSYDELEDVTKEVKITLVKKDLTNILFQLEKFGEVKLDKTSLAVEQGSKQAWAARRTNVVYAESIETDRSAPKTSRHTHRPNTKVETNDGQLRADENIRMRDVKSVPADKVRERRSEEKNVKKQRSKSSYLRKIRAVAETKYSVERQDAQDGGE